jgi:hypothetical protein
LSESEDDPPALEIPRATPRLVNRNWKAKARTTPEINATKNLGPLNAKAASSIELGPGFGVACANHNVQYLSVSAIPPLSNMMSSSSYFYVSRKSKSLLELPYLGKNHSL